MRPLVVMMFLFLLGACGPQYETHYSFTPPPQSAQATQCLQSCEIQRQQCKLLDDTRYQACQSQARADKLQCEANQNADYTHCLKKHPDKPKKCSKPFCMESSCSRNQSDCDQSYRTCYTSCGGSVTSTTICVADCDKK